MAKPLRIPIVETVEQRQPDVNKDGLAKNIFYDINARNETFATKRPGLEVFITGSGSPIGSSEYAWGIYNYELPVREIVNGNIVIGNPINLLFDFSQMTQGSSSSIGMGISKFPPVSNPAPGALPTPTPALPNPNKLIPPPTKVPVTDGGDSETGEGGSSVISTPTAAPVPVTAPTPLFVDPISGGTIWGESPPLDNTVLGRWTLRNHQGFSRTTVITLSPSVTCVNEFGTLTNQSGALHYVVENVVSVTFSPFYSVGNPCGGPYIRAWRWVVTRMTGTNLDIPVTEAYIPIETAPVQQGYSYWDANWFSFWLPY